MAKKNRHTLKNYFTNGSLPSQEHFGDLIDSMLNVIDEGFDKSAEEGLKVSQLEGTGTLMSFYEQIAVRSPIWSMRLDQTTKSLILASADKRAALSLSPDGRVGINTDHPQHELDVAGVIRAVGRIGVPTHDANNAELRVPADGKWHPITGGLDGCHAFEIMAGVGGKQGAGNYALLHAFAVNTFNSKSSITCHEAHYDSRCNQLQLRWQGTTHDYRLEIRTRCPYGDGTYSIRSYITRLWFDHQMDQSRQAEQDGRT